MSCPTDLPRLRRVAHVRRVTGFDSARSVLPSRMSDQCRQAFANGVDRLAEHGLSIGDVTRVVYLVRDSAAFSTCLPVLREVFGESRPAATLRMVPALDAPEIGIELELVASTRMPN